MTIFVLEVVQWIYTPLVPVSFDILEPLLVFFQIYLVMKNLLATLRDRGEHHYIHLQDWELYM